jgi:hypothetical protein
MASLQGGTMENNYQVVSRLNMLKAQLNRIESRLQEPKAMATCIVCQQEKALYTMPGYGSKHDMEAICYDCLDEMIDIWLSTQRCKKCHKPLTGCRIVTSDGVICEKCYNPK